MASLSKSKTLFAVTSPRSPEKIIPELKLLIDNFSGGKWSANSELQAAYFKELFESEFYQGDKFPKQPDLAARDRITRAPKSYGFVSLKPVISITEAGHDYIYGDFPEEALTKQLLKFQFPSPNHTQSRHVEFKIKPYLELLRLIKRVGSLSKTEIALFFVPMISYEEFDDTVHNIKYFRSNRSQFKGSYKMYVAREFEAIYKSLYEKEIASGNTKTRQTNDRSIKKFIKTKTANAKDYADAFTRYLLGTELVSFQPRTYRLIIAPLKNPDVDYILDNVDREPFKYEHSNQFYDYLYSRSSLLLLSEDKNKVLSQLVNLGLENVDSNSTLVTLKSKLRELQYKIKKENIQKVIVESKTQEGIKDVLQVFEDIKAKNVPDAPLFLEWNTWRMMNILNYAISVTGNFKVDLEGMPIGFAPGNTPDIEIEYETHHLIIEVTMSKGNGQWKMESESVPRHYGKKVLNSNGKDVFCLFIAPSIGEGTLAHYYTTNTGNARLYGGGTKIVPMSIDEFIQFAQTGLKNGFNNPNSMKDWLSKQWNATKTAKDEVDWRTQIQSSISSWV
jgi:hypothetical protein